jgi:iron complex outermembrane recepter protein
MKFLPSSGWRCGLIAACSLFFLASAHAAERRAFDIPAASALETFKAFAEQSGVQLLYSVESVKDVRTNAVKGDFTPTEAIRVMLADTGLDGQSTRTGAIAVNRNPLPNAERATPRSSRPETTSDEFAEKKIVLDTFEVFGRKTLNMDIQRTRDDVQPYVVFSGDSIERSGATSLEDFLRTQLPMNSVADTNSQTAGSLLGATSQVNLRGLGANQTLILVDGRRLPSINASNIGSGGFNQPDVNGIPLSAIERIEVLPTTASGIYGGAATGGVVNIILKRNYSSVETKLSYENTFDTDASTRRVEFTAGLTLEGGRTHLLLSASWSDSNNLLIGDRDFVQKARDDLMARNPDSFISPNATTPAGYTTNIRNNAPLVNGVRPNLVLKNGVSLGSPITFVPVGYAGPASDGGAALVANAGRYNIRVPETVDGTLRSMITAPLRRSLALNARRNFGPRLEVFVDASILQNNSTAQWVTNSPNATIPATAPNNPFTTAINVRFPLVGLISPRTVETETLRSVVGVIMQLPRDWMAAADYGWSRSRAESVSTAPTVGDPDGTGPGISVNTAWNTGALDAMRDLNAFPPDWTPYLLPSPNLFSGPLDTTLQTATLRVGGPAVQLPAGRLKLSGLIERREEKTNTSYVDSISIDAVRSTLAVPSRSQVVTSYYLEAHAPVFSQAPGFGFAHTLELQASVRRDDYRTSAPTPRSATLASRATPLPAVSYLDNEVSATKGTAGLRYSPVRDVVFRASVGTGFLPPTITQVAPNLSTGTIPLADPKRGNVGAPSNAAVISGGNPDLVPEESESWSAGVVFNPRFVPGLRLSLDYTRIEKLDEIASLSVPLLLELEDLLPDRVTRLPLTPADAALGYTGGLVTVVDITNINLARTDLTSWDLQLDYTRKHDKAGEFHFFSVATWQPRLLRQTLPTTAPRDAVGFTDGPLERRIVGGMTWNRGGWTLGWNTQFFDSRRSYSSTASASIAATAVLTAGFEKSPTQIFHDVFARYRFGDVGGRFAFMLANTEISCGVQNVFNRYPTIVGTVNATGGFDTFGDPRLRRYSVSVKKRF